MLLHNTDEYREGYDYEDDKPWYDLGVGESEVGALSFVLVFKIIFCRSSGRGGGQHDVYRTSATAVSANPPISCHPT